MLWTPEEVFPQPVASKKTRSKGGNHRQHLDYVMFYRCTSVAHHISGFYPQTSGYLGVEKRGVDYELVVPVNEQEAKSRQRA